MAVHGVAAGGSAAQALGRGVARWPWFLGLYVVLTGWILWGREFVPEAVFTGVKNGGYLTVTLVGVWVFRDAFARSWRTSRRSPVRAFGMVGVALGLMGVASGVSQAAAALSGAAAVGENQAAISAEVLAASTSLAGSLLFVGLGGLVAPVLEELVFREIPFGRLRNLFSGKTAMVLSSATFAAVHVRGWDEWPLMILYAGYGVALATAYLLSHRNLLVCVAAHALWNGIGLLFLLATAG